METSYQRPAFIYDETTRKKMAELIELCEKSLIDDDLDVFELTQIVHYMEENAENIHAEPFYELVENLAKIINGSNKTVTDKELNEAKKVILKYLETKPKSLYDEVIKTEYGFLDDPAPEVIFKDKTFILTGIFTIGERNKVAKMILERGGMTAKCVTRSVDYVVLGEVASSAYSHGNYGTKIDEAIELKKHGVNISIISENHFIKFINDSGIVRNVENSSIERDVIVGEVDSFRQKDIPEDGRTYYGVTLDQNCFSFNIAFEITYNHSNLGIIEKDVVFDFYSDGAFMADGVKYLLKRIIKAVDKRNGNEVKGQNLVEYIFKNLDDGTLARLYVEGILKDIPSGMTLYLAGYKTLDEIKNASDKELLGVRGIGKIKLTEIRNFLRENHENF